MMFSGPGILFIITLWPGEPVRIVDRYFIKCSWGGKKKPCKCGPSLKCLKKGLKCGGRRTKHIVSVHHRDVLQSGFLKGTQKIRRARTEERTTVWCSVFMVEARGRVWYSCMSAHGHAVGLTSTAALVLWRWVFQALVPVVGYDVHVPVHALVHLVTDDVHQPLKHLLHVDVVLGTGFKELET